MQPKLSPLWESHLEQIRTFYNSHPAPPTWASGHYLQLLAHYYRLLIPENASILEIGCGAGELLALLPNRNITGLDLSEARIAKARERLPYGKFEVCAGEQFETPGEYDFIIISGTINYLGDIQLLLDRLRRVSKPETRLILSFYNTLWRPVIEIGRHLGLKHADPPSNWISKDDVINLLDLSNWQLVQEQARILVPLPCLGLETLINRLFSPFLQALCLTVFCVARPRCLDQAGDYTVSVVIPARNESGNIEAAVLRTPSMGRSTEIIFVEGHSTDNTWEEIQRIAKKYPERDIKTLRQSGAGKGNAVREGFACASGDILMILDADLTMPPEELPKFYQVLASRHAEFANGVRLVYPMESEAMRFLNMCANKFFSIAFTWLLGQPVKDTLCGTKVLFRKDYESIVGNRAYFGNFDPFGDFDLLFGASKLNLKIADVPIRYRNRTYGSTNIHRWKHGLLLLRMTIFAARKLKFI